MTRARPWAASLETQSMQVRVITVQSVTVAVLEHRGDPALLKDSVQRFIAWRRVPLVPAWKFERST